MRLSVPIGLASLFVVAATCPGSVAVLLTLVVGVVAGWVLPGRVMRRGKA